MHKLITFALLLFFAATVEAHPSVSVVIDSRGNVYYSDLSQVWQIGAYGTKRVVVPGVHTHELAIDTAGNLYGEHLWYEGEQIDKWGHYVWKRSPDGRVTKVTPNREGFLKNYSFVRDGAGSIGIGGGVLARCQLPRDDHLVRAEDRAMQGCDLSADADANTGDGDRLVPVFVSGMAEKAINPIENHPQILVRSLKMRW